VNRQVHDRLRMRSSHFRQADFGLTRRAGMTLLMWELGVGSWELLYYRISKEFTIFKAEYCLNLTIILATSITQVK
jgi:hypothetical protein